MENKLYEFEAVIEPVPEKNGAFVRFPYDIKKELGVGRVKAEVTFDGLLYHGSIVNMGVKNADGSICYIIGVRKDIRQKIGKQAGDVVLVTVRPQIVKEGKVYQMKFSKIYPLLLAKAQKKGRTKEEVDQVIQWLTGYSAQEIEALLGSDTEYSAFFQNAPHLNENRHKIKGTVCGVKVEEITEPIMQEIRYLDKLIDELAKGKAMEKILR